MLIGSIRLYKQWPSYWQMRSFDRFMKTGPEPVPLPAGVWLILSGLGALGLMGQRRKRTAPT
ncbi:MAG: VPLPA-CTERM sorting domain-containing protein [Alphaproteobacteria bacterium]|nr:VPLPA-CTERM sorting domain-containing protein [Alphaproteobacteria bacterium]